MEYENSSKKGRKTILIVVLFLVILLVGTYAAYCYYKKNIVGENLKNEVWNYALNNDLSFFMNQELQENLTKRLQQNNFQADSHMKLSTTMEDNMFSNLDLSKFEWNYRFIKDHENDRTNQRLETKYAENDFITFDFITNSNQFAIKSDEIVNRYIGLDDQNVQSVINQIKQNEVDLSDLRKLKNFILDRENVDFSKIQKAQSLNQYAQILKEHILPENISKKENVVVTMDSEQITTTEYTISLSSAQVNDMLKSISNTIENDSEIVSELVVSKVEDFENESSGILEYTDNDHTMKVSGEEHNFNTSVQIWGENTTNEVEPTINTVPANTTIEPENTNTVQENQTQEPTNEIQSEIPNDAPTTDDTESNDEITPIEQPTTPQEQVEATEETQPEQPSNETNQEVEPEQENPEETIEQEDNPRMQGFISVNENAESAFGEGNFIIGENYEETLENISTWIEKLDWSSYLITGAKANCTQETLITQMQNSLTAIINKNSSLVIKIYVNHEGKTIKINFEFPETSESFDVEIISKGEQEKYLNMTSLVGEKDSSNGHTVSLYRKISSTMDRMKITINGISKNKISQKTSLDIQTKGASNAKNYTTNFNLSYVDAKGEFKIETETVLNFDITPEIEELNTENCLFLDLLSNEELLGTIEAIQEKTKEVLSNKNTNFNIVDSNLIVQQTDQNTISQEELAAKEQAKQVLIETIRNKMIEYLNQGKELKIEDLEGLEIPGYEVNLSISSNLAIITVNGYQFKLDSEFNLSNS